MSIDEMRRSAFYHELGRRCHHVHMTASVLRRTAALYSVVGWSAGDGREPYGEDDRRFMQTILPHVRRAMRLGDLLAEQQDALRRRDEALDQLAHGIIMLDRRGRVLFANRKAEAHFAAFTAIGVRRDRLVGAESGDDAALRALIDDCLGIGCRYPRGGAVILRRADRNGPVVILGSPLPVAERVVLDYGERAAAILVLRDLNDQPASLTTSLQSAFSLTPAEADLVQQLTAGQLTSDIAAARGVRPDTIRTQLKSVFQKTDTHGQSQLVTLAAKLAATLPKS